jgi:hypothetical protein
MPQFMQLHLLAILLSLGLVGCSDPLCTSETVKSLKSPDGNHKAILFMRECGATTDFTTQVSVDPLFYQVTGNIFVADGYNGGTRGDWGGPWAEIRWVAPNHLLITYDQQVRIFNKQEEVRGIKITYRSLRR